jgi:hypothetical protein
VRWHHISTESPVLIYSELNESNWETRKVELFLDGSAGFAGPSASSGSTFLSLEPLPALSEIAAD